jgi:hypothetical protein
MRESNRYAIVSATPGTTDERGRPIVAWRVELPTGHRVGLLANGREAATPMPAPDEIPSFTIEPAKPAPRRGARRRASEPR